jgi:hypothetical protein
VDRLATHEGLAGELSVRASGLARNQLETGVLGEGQLMVSQARLDGLMEGHLGEFQRIADGVEGVYLTYVKSLT